MVAGHVTVRHRDLVVGIPADPHHRARQARALTAARRHKQSRNGALGGGARHRSAALNADGEVARGMDMAGGTELHRCPPAAMVAKSKTPSTPPI
ncbi:MAG: hypothetical protein NVSMB17_17830 [Candidatus Dormibacteria bacterium]